MMSIFILVVLHISACLLCLHHPWPRKRLSYNMLTLLRVTILTTFAFSVSNYIHEYFARSVFLCFIAVILVGMNSRFIKNIFSEEDYHKLRSTTLFLTSVVLTIYMFVFPQN